jgi:hypothetical protein
VPGCWVAIAPRLIGVPVAATPGFLPQDEVPAAAALDAGAALDVVPAGALLVLELLLHPARTPPTARIATAAPTSREGRRENLSMWSAFSG